MTRKRIQQIEDQFDSIGVCVGRVIRKIGSVNKKIGIIIIATVFLGSLAFLYGIYKGVKKKK